MERELLIKPTKINPVAYDIGKYPQMITLPLRMIFVKAD